MSTGGSPPATLDTSPPKGMANLHPKADNSIRWRELPVWPNNSPLATSARPSALRPVRTMPSQDRLTGIPIRLIAADGHRLPSATRSVACRLQARVSDETVTDKRLPLSVQRPKNQPGTGRRPNARHRRRAPQLPAHSRPRRRVIALSCSIFAPSVVRKLPTISALTPAANAFS